MDTHRLMAWKRSCLTASRVYDVAAGSRKEAVELLGRLQAAAQTDGYAYDARVTDPDGEPYIRALHPQGREDAACGVMGPDAAGRFPDPSGAVGIALTGPSAERDAALATVLAALRFYREAGMGEPDARPDAIHGIATAGDEVVSLDGDGIAALEAELAGRAADGMPPMPTVRGGAGSGRGVKAVLEVRVTDPDALEAASRASRRRLGIGDGECRGTLADRVHWILVDAAGPALVPGAEVVEQWAEATQE